MKTTVVWTLTLLTDFPRANLVQAMGSEVVMTVNIQLNILHYNTVQTCR